MDVPFPFLKAKSPVSDQRFPVSDSRFPIVERPSKFPVTHELMADHLARGLPCVTPVQKLFLQVLHDGVRDLVFKLAEKYGCTCCGEEVEDLAQNCWHRIFLKLHTYKASKGKFTTWCWRVCSSVLNGNYRRARRRTEPIVDMPEDMDERLPDSRGSATSELGMDIREAVVALRRKNPRYGNIISAMFMTDDGILCDDIDFEDVSRRSGEPSHVVSRFHHDVVRPFFMDWFKGGN